MTLTPDDIQAIGEFVGVILDEKIHDSEIRVEKKIDEKIHQSESRLGDRISGVSSQVQEVKSDLGEKIDFLAGEVRKIDQKQDLFAHQLIKHEDRIVSLENDVDDLAHRKRRSTQKK